MTMASQQYEYWQPQQDSYSQHPQASYYEYAPPDLTSLPSLSASPTSTATFDAAGTPTPAPQQPQQMQHPQQHQQPLSYHQRNTQSQPRHAPSYHSQFAYATTGVPATPTEFSSAEEAAAAAAVAAGAAAGGLPSPPYVCSPQQNHADLGAYATGGLETLETGVSTTSTTTFPLQIVNEQGFGHGHGRMPPDRSASNGSTWSVGSGNGSIGGGGGGAATANVERTHVTSGMENVQRRRAQNRAAQRAFRERKEKHAKDLEAQLAVLSDRYGRLEQSHAELNTAYERLRRTLELLTAPTSPSSPSCSSELSPPASSDADADGEFEVEGLMLNAAGGGEMVDVEALARGLRRRGEWLGDNGQKEVVRRLVEILHAPPPHPSPPPSSQSSDRFGTRKTTAAEEENVVAGRRRGVKCES
ncbi:basic-leucine zipper transcription factor [Diplodia corticola]|uniref:Basic-leucine zipper transcription factor n=1 Tax=Diplodia corticola TaxID=236234 RepID=A0A1J9REP1_9PEZI|nr:basic-leucine zipper transcription factor [Diplodia corticola]OJD39016.1 basic-leucine zipper transcription factor [Diplodia corticola]